MDFINKILEDFKNNVDSSGAGATVDPADITVTAGAITNVNVTSGGTNFGPALADTLGGRLRYDKRSNNEIVSARRLKTTETISLTVTDQTRYFTVAASAYQKLYVGDVFIEGGNTYRISHILNNVSGLFDTAFSGAGGATTFTKVGVGLLESVGTDKYIVYDVMCIITGATDWTAGASVFDHIRIRTNGSGPVTIATVPLANLVGAGGQTKLTVVNTQGGLGENLTAGYGVEAVMVDAGGTLVQPGAGSDVKIIVKATRNHTSDTVV